MVDDAVALLGFLLVACGLGMYSLPLAMIFSGIVLAAMGVIGHLNNRDDNDPVPPLPPAPEE